MSTVLDLIILALVGGITYALMSEGLWGAALMFFNTLFAALIAFNFYEPLAQLAVDNFPDLLDPYADSLVMMLIFIVALVVLRLITESVAPTMVRFPTPVYHLGRVVFGLGAAVVMMAMVILAYQASPVQKKMLAIMDYKYTPFYGARFDRDFLAFFQYSTGYTFARNGAGPADTLGEFRSRPLLFDPKAVWLLEHQRARPIGTEDVLDEGEAGAAAAGGAGGGTGAEGGGSSGMPAPNPGGTSGPGIPGGTAGAAAGLAPTNP